MQAETDAREVPAEHDEELLCCAVTVHWNRLRRKAVESPSFEIFGTCLDRVLCHGL